MGFFDDFQSGLDRQKVATGREAGWFDPRGWSWPTRIVVGLIFLLALLNLTFDLAIEIWDPDWSIEWNGDYGTGLDGPSRDSLEPDTSPPETLPRNPNTPA